MQDMTTQSAEALAVRLAHMDRADLIRTLRNLHCPFPLDFSDDCLAEMSLERLRHVVLAAALHDRR